MEITKGYAGNIYYETTGEGEPVLFIHGIESDRRLWEKQFMVLSKNFKTIRIDLRGFGNSEMPDELFSNNRDILSVLDKLEVSEVHIAGFSFGAVIALQFALEYEKKVKSISLISPGLPWFNWSDELKKYFNDFQIAYANDRDEMFRLLYWKTVFGPDRKADGLHEYCEHLRAMFEPVLDKPRLGKLETFNFNEEMLQRLSVPILIIAGEKDFSDYLEIARTYHALFKNSKLFILKSGHILPLESSDIVSRLIEEFTNQI